MTTRNLDFENTPILTPERIAEDPVAAFAVYPRCIRLLAITPGEEGSAPPVITFVIGGRAVLTISLTLAEAAVLCEMVRLGHRLVVNSNGAKPIPRLYARFMPRDAPDDLMSLTRIFRGVGDNEVIKQGVIKSDLRNENLGVIPGGKPNKDARQTSMRHVERLAREREAGGTLPKDFDIPAYLANIERLFAIIDAEAWGRDPLGALPIIPPEQGVADRGLPSHNADGWPFPELTTGEKLDYLRGAAFTIAFALYSFEDHQVAAFLRDWTDHKDLSPWVKAA